jgi:two-component system, OmpR family, response regulator MtrA
MPITIMLVEDDEALRSSLERWLTDANFSVVSVGDGLQVVDLYREAKPNLVLMDIQLPGRNGIELVRDIRAISSATPIIMVTARSEAKDMEEAYDAGADDYFEKSPWQPEKLMARINNCLRAARASVETDAEVLKIGPLTLDIVGHEVRRNGEKIALTPLEFKLLATLAEKPKMVFSREQLLKDVWDYPYQGDTRLVNVHIQRLRSKIEDDPDNPKIVETVRGIGYKAGQN